MLSYVQKAFGDFSDLVWTQEIHSGLKKVFVSGINLIQSLHFQPAEFRIMMWGAYKDNDDPVLYDAATMEDIMGESDETLIHRPIQRVVFPPVFKVRNERGEEVRWG